MGVKVSEVERRYTKGDQHLHVKIVDGAYNRSSTPASRWRPSSPASRLRVSRRASRSTETRESRSGTSEQAGGARRRRRQALRGLDRGEPVESGFVRSIYNSLDRARLAALK